MGTPAGGTTVMVPEPGTLTLLVLSGLILVRRR